MSRATIAAPTLVLRCSGMKFNTTMKTYPDTAALWSRNWSRPAFVTPLYYHDLISPDGAMRKSPDYPELNSFTEVYIQIFGKPPSGIKYETLKAANLASQNMNRVALVPPGTPPP